MTGSDRTTSSSPVTANRVPTDRLPPGPCASTTFSGPSPIPPQTDRDDLARIGDQVAGTLKLAERGHQFLAAGFQRPRRLMERAEISMANQQIATKDERRMAHHASRITFHTSLDQQRQHNPTRNHRQGDLPAALAPMACIRRKLS